MANGSFQFSATSSDLQRSLSAAIDQARQKHGMGRVVTQNFVQDPQTGVYTGTIVYEPTPQKEKDAMLDAVKRALVEDARANGTVTPTPAPTVTQAPAPDTVRNVRNNNPGNLRTGDVETAQRYYGEDAVTGVDEGGFAQFSSPRAGISALQQQVRVDTNRGMNLGEFLNKYTPESDDPSGNKAAKTNIPKLVNANLDTPLENIDPTELTLAITLQEGGNEALQAFEPGIRRSAPTLADIERGAANAEKIARERETSMARAPAESPSGMRDFRKQRLIDADAGGLLRETATGMSNDQLLERMMMDQLEIGEKARDVPQDVSRDIQPQSGSVRGAVRTAELQQRANPPIEEEPAFRGTTVRGGRVIKGSKPTLLEAISQAFGFENIPKKGRRRSKQYRSVESDDVADPSFSSFQPSAPLKIISMDEAARTADRPRGLPTLQRDITDPDMTDDTVTADAQKVELDLEGMAPPQQTLLQRIGNALKNNPELAASGVQLLGGLISNAAQNRAQRRADRTTDQRVARANLISALTGGRARPTVERAQADTGGFLSLDTLGKAFQGGGAAVKGELARQVEEAERERKAGLAERGMKASELGVKSLDDYRKATLAFNKKKLDKETQLAAEQNVVDYLKAAKDLNESERIPIKEIGELSSELASLKRLDNLEDFIVDADFSFLEMGPLRLEEPSQFIFGSDARVAQSAIQGLIAEVAKTIPGVLTEGDQKRLETRLLSLNDTESTALDVAQAFREELLVKFEERLGALKGSGRYDTTYFDDRLMEYRQGRGAQGFEQMLTKDEIVLGG